MVAVQEFLDRLQREGEPEPVQENERCKLLWNFTIHTDKVLEHRRPDIVVIDKEEKECILIDLAVPGD